MSPGRQAGFVVLNHPLGKYYLPEMQIPDHKVPSYLGDAQVNISFQAKMLLGDELLCMEERKVQSGPRRSPSKNPLHCS